MALRFGIFAAYMLVFGYLILSGIATGFAMWVLIALAICLTLAIVLSPRGSHS